MIPRIEPMIKIGMSKPGIPPPPPIRTDIEVVLVLPVSSNASGFPYKDCQHSASNTVIKVTSGDETRINQERTNCYDGIF